MNCLQEQEGSHAQFRHCVDEGGASFMAAFVVISN